jgi:hypothetical protein
MSYYQAKSVLEKMERALQDTRDVIAGFPRDHNGIIPDRIQYSHDFRFRKRELKQRENALDNFTRRFQKDFRDEIKQDKMK